MARRYVRRKTQIEWYGDELLDLVEEYGDEALFAGGEVVLEAAERRVPRKTGRLAASGYISTATRSTYVSRRYWRKEKKPPKGAATIAFSAPHGHLVEGGRRKSGRFGPRGDVSREGVLRRTGKRALRIGNVLRARSRYRRISSRPFLGPALEETHERMAEAIADKLGKRWAWRLPGGRR